MQKIAAILLVAGLVAGSGAGFGGGYTSLQPTVTQLQGQIGQLTTNLSQAQNDLTAAKEQITKARSELSSTKSDLFQKNADLSKSQADLSDTKGQLSKAQADLSSVRSDLSQRATELMQAQTTINNLNSQITQKNADLAKANADLSQANSEIQRLNSQAQGLNSQVQSLTTQIQNLNAQISSLNTDRTRLQGELATAKDNATALTRDLQRLKSQGGSSQPVAPGKNITVDATGPSFVTYSGKSHPLIRNLVIFATNSGNEWEGTGYYFVFYRDTNATIGVTAGDIFLLDVIIFNKITISGNTARLEGMITLSSRWPNPVAKAVTVTVTDAGRGLTNESASYNLALNPPYNITNLTGSVEIYA
jgi:peptidoglycan hydrolase CwlO-like protein